jgi:3-methyladenine DNA glycosylase AlkC
VKIFDKYKIMQIVKKENVKINIGFVVNSDLDILEKLRSSKEKYIKNNISYSVNSCYEEHSKLVDNY